MQTLPDFFNFGTTPTSRLTEQGFDPDVELNDIEVATEEIDDFGVDISLDTSTMRVSTTAGQDLRIKPEMMALHQWCVMALLTPRGGDILYGESFGSELADLIGRRLPQDASIAEIPTKVREALLVHGRIIDVREFRYSNEDNVLTVSFEVVTDTDDTLEFEGLSLG